jgi:hypothetical protein
MNWTRLLGWLATLGVAVWAVGAVVSLATNTLTGDSVTAAVAVLALVLVSLVVAVRVGARSAAWRANPDSYW